MEQIQGRAQRTKNSILRAAEQVFAAKGMDGARVDEIAEVAGANKRMIYAYYGSKEQLYEAVLAAVYSRLRECETAPAADEDPRRAIRALVHAYFVFLKNNPSYVRMVMWENLYEARHFDEGGLMDVRSPIRQAMRDLLRRGKATGVFRMDVEEEQVLMTLFACTFNYFSNIHTMSRVMKQDLLSEEAMNAREEDVALLLQRYLEP